MKQAIIGQIIFYYIFFVLFFILMIMAINNRGWGFIAILNAIIATIDFVRGTRLLVVYLQLRNKK